MKETYITKLEGKEWKECIDNAFKKKRKDLKIDGFRKGQIPQDVYIKKFGIESLYMDAVDLALPIMYEKLLKDEKTIKPVVSPDINIKNIDEKHVEVEFILIANPEVKLGKYKKLGIKKEEIKITKKDIEHEIEHLKEQFIEFKLLDEKEKIKNGYTAILDFEGFLDDKPFEGGKAENYQLIIGSNSFIPGFEEALIGMKKGEKKDINLKFPENYHSEDLKGKDVVFKVKINEIKEKILPELNEDFFKDLGLEGIDTKEKLEEEIKTNLEVQQEKKVDDEYTMKCLEEVLANSKFDVPQEIVNEEIERIIKEFSEQLNYQGMHLDKYLQMSNISLEDLKEQIKPEATKRVSFRIVIEAIIKKENIEATEEEINKEIDNMSVQYNMPKEELLKALGNKEMIKFDIQNKKALKLISE